MELILGLALMLAMILAVTYVGAFLIALTIILMAAGALPWWAVVLVVVAVFAWPETARERRSRADEIETERTLRDA